MSTEFETRVISELADIKRLLGIKGSATHGAAPPRPSAPEFKVASAYEMDDKYGNPEVRRDPKRWSGESCVGHKFSDCPADYLLVTAEFNEWKASNPRVGDDPKWQKYAIKDAALARGWAARNQGGTAAAATSGGYTKRATPAQRPADEHAIAGGDGFDDDQIPF